VLLQSMTPIADLWRLQEIDTALDGARASFDDARDRTGETDELRDARARVDELAALLRDATTTQKDIELEADDLRAKIAPLEEKLYGGSIRNPKELSDLQADIDQIKRHMSAVEDRDLEALAAVEAAEGDHRRAREELASIEAAWREEQDDLGERSGRLAGEISRLEEERREQAGRVGAELLARYEHVRRTHHGRGVAKLDRNVCQGCRISLPVSLVNRTRAGTSVVQCPNCERILHA
jgi:predicted  nucleic acid-binding Zn-ribbon protein